MNRCDFRFVASLLLALVSAGIFAEEGVEPSAGQPQTEQQNVEKKAITDADCLECHGQKGFAVPLGEDGSPPYRHLDVDAAALRASIHGRYRCLDCHSDIESLPHDQDLETVDCVNCHIRQGEGAAPERAAWLHSDSLDIVIQTKRYTHSVHAQKKGAKDKEVAGIEGLEGQLIPPKLIILEYFQAEQTEIDNLQNDLDMVISQKEELLEEHSGDEGALHDVSSKKDAEFAKKEYIIQAWEEYLPDTFKSFNKIYQKLLKDEDELTNSLSNPFIENIKLIL
ncbi:MAG: hypothetical protein DSZ33_04530, partial [Gammaproteobacteria bacterium]